MSQSPSRRTLNLTLAMGLAASMSPRALAQDKATETRPAGFALVIGNSDYDGDGRIDASPNALRDAADRGFVGDLANTWQDAMLMSRMLRSMGFDVREAFNCDRSLMIGHAANLRARARSAGPEARIIIYYAGHGIQIAGNNYLVPIRSRLLSADLETPEDIERAVPSLCLPVSEMLISAARPTAPGYTLLMLDACRDNPWEDMFAERAGAIGRDYSERGMVVMVTPSPRVIVSYASSPGGFALDGKALNGPYAAAFSNAARTPGVTVDAILDRVWGEVSATSSGRQTPWVSGRLMDGTLL